MRQREARGTELAASAERLVGKRGEPQFFEHKVPKSSHFLPSVYKGVPLLQHEVVFKTQFPVCFFPNRKAPGQSILELT